jgi:ribonuclease Z
MTLSLTGERYVVHELLAPADTVTSCDPAALHMSECPGQDFVCDAGGFWRGVASGTGYWGEVVVDAGPIRHRGKKLRSHFLLYTSAERATQIPV